MDSFNSFERLMETVLARLNWKMCLVYLGDVIVFGKTFEEEIERLRLVLTKLKAAGLKLKPNKCKLFQKQVLYLGHIVSDAGISTDPDKIKAKALWTSPTNLTELRSSIGLISYYRRFVPKFATIASPLHKFTNENQPFIWNEECEHTFQLLKSKLMSPPILSYPTSHDPFILDTDASDVGIGAVLSQNQNGSEKVISYASRALTKPERKYCVTCCGLVCTTF